MSSSNEISVMLQDEFKKLDKLIDTATDSELSISDTVNLYYQVINVSSILATLKQLPDSSIQVSKINERILEFNNTIHPKILSNLTSSIKETIEKLTHTQSKENTEYDELREKMSTKEFVEQYDKELSNN